MFQLAILRKLRSCSICGTECGPAECWYDTVRHVDFCHVCQASHLHTMTQKTPQVQTARATYEDAYLRFTHDKGQATETIQAFLLHPRYICNDASYHANMVNNINELKAHLTTSAATVRALSNNMDVIYALVREQYEHSLVRYSDHYIERLLDDSSDSLHEEYDDELEHRLLSPAEQILHTALSQTNAWQGRQLTAGDPTPPVYHVYGAEGPYLDAVRGLCVRKLLWAFTWEETVPNVDTSIIVRGTPRDAYIMVRWPDEQNICLSEFQRTHPPNTISGPLLQRLRIQAEVEARWL